MRAYAHFLRSPHVAVLLAATTLTRLPFAINGLAVLLFVRELTGSFATAGLVTGALGVGTAVGAPMAARLVDRRGTRVLMPLALAHAIALLAIWGLGSSGAPDAALAAAALGAGAAFPPSGSVLRSRWHELVSHPDLVRTAYALDSVMIEVSFVTGPLITAVIVALTGAEVALALSAVLVIVGTAMFLARLPDGEGASEEDETPRGFLGPLSQPAIRMIALTTVPVGFCIGTVEVALPAFSQEEGSAALAGILLAVWSGASGVGGLVFGARRPSRSLAETFLVIAVVFPLACLPLAGATSPLAMGALIALAGLPIAPLISSRNELVSRLAPRGAATESFTWLLTALLAGAAAGSATGGALVDSDGWRAAILVGSAVAALGAGLAVALRRTLRPSFSR
ncbi:MAG: MFS transporter [Actinomycetota bacterium]